jgi:hypothetical protein
VPGQRRCRHRRGNPAFAVYLLDRQHLPVERTAEVLAALLGTDVSTGWLCQVQAEEAGKLAPFITELKDRLSNETGRPY